MLIILQTHILKKFILHILIQPFFLIIKKKFFILYKIYWTK
jgi:hypothetical protein